MSNLLNIYYKIYKKERTRGINKSNIKDRLLSRIKNLVIFDLYYDYYRIFIHFLHHLHLIALGLIIFPQFGQGFVFFFLNISKSFINTPVPQVRRKVNRGTSYYL